MLKTELVKRESEAINRNIPFLFIMAFSGIFFGSLANSSAIVLDGTFSLILFLSVFLAKFVQKKSSEPANFIYPHGKWQLDSLYIIFKVLILFGILFYSSVDAIRTIFEYIIHTEGETIIKQGYANWYYLIKFIAFGISYAIYYHYEKLVDFKSQILHLERKSVFIDGIITISIFLGFRILGRIELIAPISDSIILLLLSLFLMREMTHEFKHILQIILGKRIYLERENYYKAMFNVYFYGINFSDVHIQFYGKTVIVSIVSSFEGKLSMEQLCELETEIKQLMFEEYDKVFLQMYWDRCPVVFKKDLKEFE